MEQSPRLSLPYVQPAQAQKHVTVNETFRRLDALTQLTVLSQTIAAEPGAPAEGDAYILPASSTGSSWAGFTTGNVAAFQDGAWVEIMALEGFHAWVSDVDQFVTFNGASWVQVSGGSSETALKFGVNATADTTSRLSVKSDAVIFSHDDVTPGNDDCIVKVNKKAVGDTASHIFQAGFSGRAEFGLTGDDDFHIKVSPDGSSWLDALLVKTDGKVGINTLNPEALLHISLDGVAVDAASLLSSGDKIVLSGSNVAPGFAGVAVGSTANERMVFKGIRARGTLDTPTSAADNDKTFSLLGALFDGTSDKSTAAISFAADGTLSTGNFPQGIIFETGVTSRSVRLEITSNGSLIVGSPTGGAKGVGTINAKGVYDDNTLLTCYVFDQALDGAIDDQKWDAKVPDRMSRAEYDEIEDPETGETVTIETSPSRKEERTHQPMRKFRARIGSEHDPLTLDGYAKHWREKRHLTSLPNEVSFDPETGMSAGEWIQRLVETVEIQAVLIEELNQGLKARPEGRMNSPRP